MNDFIKRLMDPFTHVDPDDDKDETVYGDEYMRLHTPQTHFYHGTMPPQHPPSASVSQPHSRLNTPGHSRRSSPSPMYNLRDDA